MKLSIAICTFNRSEDLAVCLGAIGELGYNRTHEVIVVDNSDDSSHRKANEELVHSWRGVRYVMSAPPGLSRARNVALAEATGDVLAYLDDDATCLQGWAESILAAFADEDVVCAGGPILPEWETPKPEWLGGELMLSLAVMDLGEKDRDLPDTEFFFGANVAFRRGALQSIGGFAEHLGRTKADLMGDEEIDVQRRLRARGRSRYAAGAKILHHIHAERCSMQWFLKRYAWQGVSDARAGDEGTLQYLATLLNPDDLPGVGAAVRELLTVEPDSTAQAVARARFVRGFVGALLNDRVPVPRASASTTPKRSLEAPEFEPFKCQVPGDTEVLFVELGVAHSYLYGAYGEIPGSFLLNPKLNAGQQPQECAEFLRNTLFFASRAGVKAVVLLTADVLTWPGYEHVLDRRDPGVGVYGFVHRVPEDAHSAERLKNVSRKVESLFVYADQVKQFLEDQHGLENVNLVPHPPVFMGNAIPRAPLTPTAALSGKRRVVLGMLGEVRRGKGYEFAIEALSMAPLAIRSRVKVVMAGAVEEEADRRIRAMCAQAGIVADLHLRPRSGHGYRTIPDNLFARAVAECDVMVFPYENDHRLVFSGHFVDALLAGACFLATSETVLGDVVERNRIGETFEAGDPRSFGSALERLLVHRDTGCYSGPDRSRLAAEYSRASACRALVAILQPGAAGLPATPSTARAACSNVGGVAR